MVRRWPRAALSALIGAGCVWIDVDACPDAGCYVDADSDADTDADADADADADTDADTGPDLPAIDLVTIAPGTFTIGSPDGADVETGRDPDEYEREVRITRPFLMATHETTRAVFRAFMDGVDPTDTLLPDCDACPVEGLTWDQAAVFANRVSAGEGLPACYACAVDSPAGATGCILDPAWATAHDCEGYRLPTEAEWEYAARAGSTGAFTSGGGLETGDVGQCGGGVVLDDGTPLDEIAWYCGNSGDLPLETPGRGPNGNGLYGVHGGGAEWCHDWYHEDAYLDLNADSVNDDPTGPSADESPGTRVYRSGHWLSRPEYLRLANRASDFPDDAGAARDHHVGVRLARTTP